MVNRPAEVLELLRDVSQEFPDDAVKIAAAESKRIRALQMLGRVDEAVAMLEALIQAYPNAKGISASAAELAQELDKRGVALRQADAESREADALWRQAARFYVVAVRGQLEGSEAIRVQEMEPIAARLFSLSLFFNGVPKDVDSIVDWNGGPFSDDLLQDAVRAYQAVLPLTPSYRTRINLAQALGFLGRWVEAAAHYAELFDREVLVDPVTRAIRADVVRAKPELVFAYLEWGVCERSAGLEESDTGRVVRASTIFETLVLGNPAGSKLWWQAKYFFVQLLADRGDYRAADVAVKSLERNYPDFDGGQYGLQARFVKLRDELKKKVFD